MSFKALQGLQRFSLHNKSLDQAKFISLSKKMLKRITDSLGPIQKKESRFNPTDTSVHVTIMTKYDQGIHLSSNSDFSVTYNKISSIKDLRRNNATTVSMEGEFHQLVSNVIKLLLSN